MVQGAVLGRDASGNLAIQLIASGAISPQQAAQLRSDLIRRMEQKRLKIASLEVSTGEADKQGLPQRQRPA
jgi:polyhydroxyalkanoate synthesis regulator phasin